MNTMIRCSCLSVRSAAPEKLSCKGRRHDIRAETYFDRRHHRGHRKGGTLPQPQRTGRSGVDLSRYPDHRTTTSTCIAVAGACPYGSVHRRGGASDRYREAEATFQQLNDPYERLYYAGILCERRAKAQLHAGQPSHTLLPLFEQALRSFAEAEKVRPAGNDDAILRWNRCVRLLQTTTYVWEQEPAPFDVQDAPPT